MSSFRLYTVLYEIFDDLKTALSGRFGARGPRKAPNGHSEDPYNLIVSPYHQKTNMQPIRHASSPTATSMRYKIRLTPRGIIHHRKTVRSDPEPRLGGRRQGTSSQVLRVRHQTGGLRRHNSGDVVEALPPRTFLKDL